MTRLPQFHAAKWDEPVVMELGRPGGRGQLFPAPEAEVTEAVGADLIPGAWPARTAPTCPRSPSSRRSGITCTSPR
jgi:glycine dehydrogenase subunit 2